MRLRTERTKQIKEEKLSPRFITRDSGGSGGAFDVVPPGTVMSSDEEPTGPKASGSGSSSSAVADSGVRQERQKVPLFAGEGDATLVSDLYRDWEETFEAYMVSMRIMSEGRKLAQARQGMKEGSPAREWFVTCAKNPEMRWNDWAACKAAMRKRFLITESAAQTSCVRATLWMRDDEDVRRFADRCFKFQTNLRLAHDVMTTTGAHPDSKTIVLNAVAEHDRKHAFMAGLRPALREQVGGVLDTDKVSFQEIVDTACRYEQVAQDGKLQAGTVHAVGYGSSSGGKGCRGKRGGGPSGAGSKPTARPGWIRLRELPPDICFTCGYSGHMAATCTVPPERQVWDATIKKLGLQKKKGASAPATSSQPQQQQSTNLIDVVAQQQQQIRLQQQQLAAIQQPPPQPVLQPQPVALAPQAVPPAFQNFLGTPLPPMASNPQPPPTTACGACPPGVQTVQGNSGMVTGSYADFQ